MEWWQEVMLYFGIYLLGFMTGLNAGTAGALRKLIKPPPPPQMPGGGMPDMLKMMQGMTGGGGKP